MPISIMFATRRDRNEGELTSTDQGFQYDLRMIYEVEELIKVLSETILSSIHNYGRKYLTALELDEMTQQAHELARRSSKYAQCQ